MLKKRTLNKSFELWEKAQSLIPGGTQTLSKGPNMFTYGVYPVFLDRGQGSHVWDVDGNEYIDYPLALGPVSLGYNYPATIEAVTTQLAKGTTFSLMHPLEVEVAELLCEIIPCAEMVRFAKNGADATSGAVRIARAATGREHIASCGYHGFHDWYMVGTDYNAGCPGILKDYIHSFKYNDIKSLEKIFSAYPDQIAAVIIEPVSIDPPENDFLESVKDLCRYNGCILIFDEIVTGFRLALGGAQEYYQVTPDLAAFGKGMANGLPISAVVGKRSVMKTAEKVFFSTTYGGECLSLAAAKSTIHEMRTKNVPDYFWQIGALLQAGTIDLLKGHDLSSWIHVKGLSPKFWIDFTDSSGNEDDDLKGLFFQEAIKRGVLIGGLQYVSYSHSREDIDYTLSVFDVAMRICRKAIEEKNIKKYLEGLPPTDIFRKR